LERTSPFNARIYVQDYGTSLVIGRAVVEGETLSRFKWMAAAAFEHLIDTAIGRVVDEEHGREVTVRGEKSTDTSV
jgi:predicted transcriptional regulator